MHEKPGHGGRPEHTLPIRLVALEHEAHCIGILLDPNPEIRQVLAVGLRIMPGVSVAKDPDAVFASHADLQTPSPCAPCFGRQVRRRQQLHHDTVCALPSLLRRSELT